MTKKSGEEKKVTESPEINFKTNLTSLVDGLTRVREIKEKPDKINDEIKNELEKIRKNTISILASNQVDPDTENTYIMHFMTKIKTEKLPISVLDLFMMSNGTNLLKKNKKGETVAQLFADLHIDMLDKLVTDLSLLHHSVREDKIDDFSKELREEERKKVGRFYIELESCLRRRVDEEKDDIEKIRLLINVAKIACCAHIYEKASLFKSLKILKDVRVRLYKLGESGPGKDMVDIMDALFLNSIRDTIYVMGRFEDNEQYYWQEYNVLDKNGEYSQELRSWVGNESLLIRLESQYKCYLDFMLDMLSQNKEKYPVGKNTKEQEDKKLQNNQATRRLVNRSSNVFNVDNFIG